MKTRKSIRLKNYDYSSDGCYFVTIGTQNRECLFGEIGRDAIGRENPARTMKLNDAGKIVDELWNKLPDKYECIELDTFQIMPDHIHMIIIIVGARSSRPIGSSDPGHNNRVIGHNNPIINGRENPAPTLGQIVAFFKYQSTKQINDYFVRAGVIPPGTIRKIWQRNYYERIIRNENELQNIREYIQTNPQIWGRQTGEPRFDM